VPGALIPTESAKYPRFQAVLHLHQHGREGQRRDVQRHDPTTRLASRCPHAVPLHDRYRDECNDREHNDEQQNQDGQVPSVRETTPRAMPAAAKEPARPEKEPWGTVELLRKKHSNGAL
jgi:hypothetical protein